MRKFLNLFWGKLQWEQQEDSSNNWLGVDINPTSWYPDDGAEVCRCERVLKVFKMKEELFDQIAVLQVQVLPGLVSAGRVSLSPAGGGGCRTADWRPGLTRGSTPSRPARQFQILCSDWLRSWCCYAIKTKFKAPKVPCERHFLSYAVSLWHEGDFHALKGSIIAMQLTITDALCARLVFM